MNIPLLPSSILLFKERKGLVLILFYIVIAIRNCWGNKSSTHSNNIFFFYCWSLYTKNSWVYTEIFQFYNFQLIFVLMEEWNPCGYLVIAWQPKDKPMSRSQIHLSRWSRSPSTMVRTRSFRFPFSGKNAQNVSQIRTFFILVLNRKDDTFKTMALFRSRVPTLKTQEGT